MISSTTFKGAELTAAATRAFCPICTTSYPLGTTVCAQDGTELVLADELTGVTVGGGFVVGGLVRSDGLSTMYEAAHPNVPGARFALLAVHAQHAEAGALWMRFKSKELALRALKHARAAHVRELGRTEDGRPFVVGVFPDGTPLSELLGDSTKVDARGVTRLGRQLAQAVAAAHRKAIVHHDLRPENVYVTGSLDEPRVTVFGFGLSVFKEASLKGTEETGSHTTVYVAPEQAEGTVGDHRADVYSIGAILFRALTGQEPSHALGNEVEATLRKLAPEAPATLVSALARTMALSPSGRFAFLEKFDAAIAPMDAEADEELFDQMFDVLDASAEAPPVSSGPTAGPERIRVVPRASGAGAPPKPVVPRPPVPEVREAALASAEALTPPPPSIGAAGRVGALSRAFGLTPAAPRVSLRPAPAVPGEKGPGAADQHPGARHADAPAEREATRTPSEPPQAAPTPPAAKVETTPAAEDLAGGSAPGSGPLMEAGLDPNDPTGLGLGPVLEASPSSETKRSAAATSPQSTPPKSSSDAPPSSRPSSGPPSSAVSPAGGPQGPRRNITAWAAVVGVGLGVAIAAGVALLRNGEPATGAPTSSATTAATTAPVATTAVPETTSAPTTAAPEVPQDAAEQVRALLDAMRAANFDAALDALRNAAKADPTALEASEPRAAVLSLVQKLSAMGSPKAAEAFDLVARELGSLGPDLLLEIATTRGGSAAAESADRLLEDRKVFALGTPAMRIAYELRQATSCEQKLALFQRAGTDGDVRAQAELIRIRECHPTAGCCMRDNPLLVQLIDALGARLGGGRDSRAAAPSSEPTAESAPTGRPARALPSAPPTAAATGAPAATPATATPAASAPPPSAPPSASPYE